MHGTRLSCRKSMEPAASRWFQKLATRNSPKRTCFHPFASASHDKLYLMLVVETQFLHKRSGGTAGSFPKSGAANVDCKQTVGLFLCGQPQKQHPIHRNAQLFAMKSQERPGQHLAETLCTLPGSDFRGVQPCGPCRQWKGLRVKTCKPCHVWFIGFPSYPRLYYPPKVRL